jgi:tRNA (cmo5U34)-methyltransferase
VAAVFDDMLERSVPFYVEQQGMVVELARRFWQQETLVVDLGCSTGTTLVSVCSALRDTRAIGVDSSAAMLARASSALVRAGLSDRVDLVEADLEAGLGRLQLPSTSVVTSCWTLQFLRPEHREGLLREVHDILVPGGALVLAEKTVPADAKVADQYTKLYEDFKRRSGYSETEIARKRLALEDVLIPLTIEENLRLLSEVGFASASTFFQWYPFTAFLAVKS